MAVLFKKLPFLFGENVKKVVLFDMDGTLTEPRDKMSIEMEFKLKELQDNGYEIGIITGSGMNYIKQQCSKLFDLSVLDASKIHFLPCNGTKYILDGKIIYQRNMRGYMGDKLWNRLISIVVGMQNDLILKHNIPLTGHFFDYRGSMLNWCPIGRNADTEDRNKWKKLNNEESIRSPLFKTLRNYIHENINFVGDLAVSDVDIVVKYGGDTSLDIFPRGWDKTYVLEHTSLFSDYDEIHFIGDRCEQNGNDYEIFMHPKTTAQQTISVEDTIRRVDRIIYDYV